MSADPTVAPPEPPAPDPGAEALPESPYRNLWVPLLVVPALIGIVLVVVFVLFGAVTGRESSAEDNLSRMISGGKNERRQASFSLVQQIVERQAALDRGEPVPHDIGPSFAHRLVGAYDACNQADADQYEQAFLYARVLLELGEAGSVERLFALAEAPDSADPEGFVRFNLLSSFGAWAERFEPAQRETANALLIRFLDHPDPGLVRAAAMSLQRYPADGSRGALRGLLGSSELDLRGQAAISLSHLADASGEGVLREMLDPQAYALAHQAQPQKFARAADVSMSRRKALEALLRLGKPEYRSLVEQLAREESDIELREAALRALAQAEGS